MNYINIILKLEREEEMRYVLDWYNNMFKKSIGCDITGQMEDRKIFLVKNFASYDEIFVVGFYYGTKIQKSGVELEPFVFTNTNEIKKISFSIMSNDDKLILDVIDDYNKRYLRSFIVDKFNYDEIIFAEISAENIIVEDVFFLGALFGADAQIKRENGLIDW